MKRAIQQMIARAAANAARAPAAPGLSLSDPEMVGVEYWVRGASISSKVDGDGLSSITDLSGNGYTTLQATGARQPIYRTVHAFGAKPVMAFDNADDSMATSLSISSGSYTILAVYGSNTVRGSAGSNTTSRALQGSNNWMMGMASYDARAYAFQYGDGSAHIGTNNTLVTANQLYVHAAKHVSGTSSKHWVNNVLQPGTGPLTGYPGTVYLGLDGVINPDNAATFPQWLDGAIAEVVIFKSAKSDADIAAMVTKLMAYYGIT